MELEKGLQERSTLFKTVAILGGVTFSFFLFYALGIFSRLGIYFVPTQSRGIASLLVLIILFLIGTPAMKRKSLPWYEIILILLTATFSLYIIILSQELLPRFGLAKGWFEITLGFLAILITLEASRRTAGWTMVIVVLVFIFYSVLGQYIPGFFHTSGAKPFTLSGQLYLSEFGMYGVVFGAIMDYFFPFVLFSLVMENVGGTVFLRDLSFRMVGQVRGRSAKVAVLLNYFFSLVSGSAVANVVVTGPSVIPEMRKEGYSSGYIGGLLATAGTASQFTPPVMGAVAFIIADYIGISYFNLVIIAFIPAALYFVSLFLLCDLDAARMGLKAAPIEEKREPVGKVILGGWHILAGVGILVWFLSMKEFPPGVAVVYSSFILAGLGMLRKRTRITWAKVKSINIETTKSLVEIVPVCLAAGIIVGAIGLTSLDYKFSGQLISLANGNIMAIFGLAAVAALILGMGLPTIPCYLIVVLLIVPALAPLHVPLVVIHMFVFYFALAAMVTPPVAISVYIAAPMVGSGIWTVGGHASRLGIATFVVPFMFVLYPAMLTFTNPAATVEAIGLSLVTMIALVFSLARYGLTRANWIEVTLGYAAALVFFIPTAWSKSLSMAIIAFLIASQLIKWFMQRKHKTKNTVATI